MFCTLSLEMIRVIHKHDLYTWLVNDSNNNESILQYTATCKQTHALDNPKLQIQQERR